MRLAKQKVWAIAPKIGSGHGANVIRVCAPDVPTALKRAIGYGLAEDTEVESVTADGEVLAFTE